MHARQRLADCGAVAGVRPPHPHAVEEGDEAAGLPHSVPSALPLRSFTGCGQVMPRAARCSISARKNGRSPARHALLVERQDVVAGAGVDEEVGILDALRDALVGQQLAQVVAGEKVAQLFGGDIGIDGHASSRPCAGHSVKRVSEPRYAAAVSRSWRGSGKNMPDSSAPETVSTFSV